MVHAQPTQCLVILLSILTSPLCASTSRISRTPFCFLLCASFLRPLPCLLVWISSCSIISNLFSVQYSTFACLLGLLLRLGARCTEMKLQNTQAGMHDLTTRKYQTKQYSELPTAKANQANQASKPKMTTREHTVLYCTVVSFR